MYLYLLEFTYAVKDRETVEAWLTEEGLSGTLISTQQYDDEIFSVLANDRAAPGDQRKLSVHDAISSCQAKQRALYRITTTDAPRVILHSFPLGEGDEWYACNERTIYLSMSSHRLGYKQISWLATCTNIVKWEDQFILRPLPILAGPYAVRAE